MKGFLKYFGPRKRVLIAMMALIANLGSVSTARATLYTLSDGNSSVVINPTAPAGMLNWTVDGQNQLYQQWFWYRIGASGLAQSIDTISSPVVSSPTSYLLSAAYNAQYFNMSVVYSLRGGAAGSGVSDVGEQITINNTSGSNLVFHFFQYSDFDLGGLSGGDNVLLGQSLNGKYNEALQWKGNISLTETFADTVASPGADHGEVGIQPQILNELMYTNGLVLNDFAGPLPMPGDASWGFEWDLTIASGSSAIISKDKNLHVPEPSILAILMASFGVALLRKRSLTP